MLSQEIAKFEVEFQQLKEENKELRQLLEVEPQKPMDCQACMFFTQHYVRAGGVYVKTNNGHCFHGRLKSRKPEDKKCQYFEKRVGGV